MTKYYGKKCRRLGKRYKPPKPYGVYNAANKALTIALKTKRLLNVEYKAINNTRSGDAITQAGIVTSLCLLSQGTTDATREGNQVKLTSIFFKYVGSMHASAVDTTVRMLIVADKQANGSNATLAQILHDATVDDALASQTNRDNKYRFSILWDKTYQMTAGGRANFSGSKYIRLNKKIRYGSNNGNATDLQSNNIMLWLISDEATNTPSIFSTMRTLFVDN